MTGFIDSASQFLTSAPLWLQAPLVLIVVVPVCGVLALVWLRLIDVLGARILRILMSVRAKVEARMRSTK
ncbi:Putative membrane protein [Corynebacterium pseudotuberculosis]|nr:Putative membrane protein [Corynebacterium pseudotuberculosis]